MHDAVLTRRPTFMATDGPLLHPSVHLAIQDASRGCRRAVHALNEPLRFRRHTTRSSCVSDRELAHALSYHAGKNVGITQATDLSSEYVLCGQ